jgi:thiol-disulfide isomerase/thioredoxin
MKNKLLFIFIVILICYFNLIGRIHGLFLNFIITGLINFILTYLLLKINPFGKMGLSMIFIPFYLLFPAIIYGLFNKLSMPGFLGFLMYIISTLFGILLLKIQNKKSIVIIYSIIFISLVYNYSNMKNYYFSIINKNKIVGEVFPELKIKNSKGELIILDKNKIILIDLWSNYCGNCIKAFPKFESVKSKYENDSEVSILSLNIIQNQEDIIKSQKFLKNFTFKNYYTENTIFKKLNFESVPNYILIGKDNKVKYFGNLNTQINESYNNIYNLIENEKKNN